MRCPECEQRNSVAVSKCKFCGTKLRRKQMTAGSKLLIGGITATVLLGLALSFTLPRLADPGESLASCAKRVAAGPKSPEDAKRIKTDLDSALKGFLERFGDDNSTKLAARLQKTLPSQAFEVHVVDLPRGLKLVEIDTLLQASDFLVMKGTTETKVFPLPDFEVFDDARAVNDESGPILVLLGHSSGQLPHKPHVRTYAILPDFIVDETDKMVPMLKGEGTAKFVGTGADVLVDLSVASMAKEEKVAFSSPLADVSIKQKLKWKDAKYVPEFDIGSDANAYLFMLGHCLIKPETTGCLRGVIGAEAAKMIKDKAGDGLGEVSISAYSAKQGGTSFALQGKGKQFVISLGREASRWQVSTYAVSDTKIVSAPAAVQVAASNSAANSSPLPTVGPMGEAAATAAPVSAPPYLAASTAPPAVAPQAVAAVKAPSVAPAVLRGQAPPVAANSLNKREEERIAEQHAREAQEQIKKDEQRRRDQEKAREQEKKTDTAQQTATISDNISSSSVRLRSRPSLKGSTVADIPRGAKLSVITKENGWYKVSYDGQTGYVYGGLVEFNKKSLVHAPAASTYPTAVVTKSWTVRDENRRAVAHPQPGDRLVIVSGINKNNKYKVQLSDGKIGYLDKSAVDVKVDTPEFVP